MNRDIVKKHLRDLAIMLSMLLFMFLASGLLYNVSNKPELKENTMTFSPELERQIKENLARGEELKHIKENTMIFFLFIPNNDTLEEFDTKEEMRETIDLYNEHSPTPLMVIDATEVKELNTGE